MTEVYYVIERLHWPSPDALPLTQYLRAVGDGDGWEWAGGRQEAWAWLVETDAELAELREFAASRKGCLCVRGTREVEPPRNPHQGRSTTPVSLAGEADKPRAQVSEIARDYRRRPNGPARPRVSPEEAFHELERRHLD